MVKPPAPCLTWEIQYNKLLEKYEGRPIHQLMALAKLSRMMGIWRRVDKESGYYAEGAWEKRLEEGLAQRIAAREKWERAQLQLSQGGPSPEITSKATKKRKKKGKGVSEG